MLWVMRVRYDNTIPLKFFEIMRGGANFAHACKILNIPKETANFWKKKYPAFRYALERIKLASEGEGITTFKSYVYGHLQGRAKVLWDKLSKLEEYPDQKERVYDLIYKSAVHVRQHLFFHAFISCNFNPTDALSKLGMTRSTLNRWIERDQGFRDLMEEFHWHKANFFEGALVGLIAGGDSAATIFANKTFNKDRGYGERQELKVSGVVEVEHEHKVEVTLIDDLNLSIEVRMKILEALRQKQLEDKSKIIDAEVVAPTPTQEAAPCPTPLAS